MKKSVKNTVAILLGIAAVVAIWYITAAAIGDETLAPSPNAVIREFFSVLGEKRTYKSIIGTLWRSIISFFISFFAAVLFAVPASFSKFSEKAFYPLIALARAVPTMSVILLCLIWLKSSLAPVAVSFIVVFPMLYAAVLNALKNRNKGSAEMLKIYGVKPVKVFFGFTFPDIFERLFPEFVSVFAFNVKLTVSGEAIAYTRQSLGREMYAANASFLTGRLMAFTLIAVLISVVLELVVKGIYLIIENGVRNYARKKSEQELRIG